MNPPKTDGETIVGPSSILTEPEWESIAALLSLSQREAEIVRRIFEGDQEAAIAMSLQISVHTVHSPLKRLYRKLEVADHREVVIRVFEAYLALSRPTATPTRPSTVRLPFRGDTSKGGL